MASGFALSTCKLSLALLNNPNSLALVLRLQMPIVLISFGMCLAGCNNDQNPAVGVLMFS